MRLPTTEQIDSLSHAELVVLVKELMVAMQRMEAENRQLKAELAKGPPPGDVTELLTAAVAGCEAQPRGKPQAQEAGAPLWACAARSRAWVAKPDRILEAPVG